MKQFKLKRKTRNKISKNKKNQIQQKDAPDKNGMYPIHVAVQNNDLGTLEALINNGANLNKYNRDKDTPLLIAVKENNPQIVEKLLEEGVDLERNDTNQKSPLDVAISLDNQECIDLLTEYSSSQGGKNIIDDSLNFVTALIDLLSSEITLTICSSYSTKLTEKILLLLQQYLDLEKISKESTKTLKTDINYRIYQFLSLREDNTKITKKELLNLTRKIIVIIQDCKKNLPANFTWPLNRIESLIEEKIVSSNGDSERKIAHIFTSNTSTKKKAPTSKETREDWYTQNGYRNFDEFARINNSGAGPIKFLKFSDINKEKILRKTSTHGTETLEITTIKPLHPTTKEEFALLIPNASKRIKEEQKLLDHSPIELKTFNTLLDKAKNEDKISIDESLQLDKILRPGKKNKIHLIHFHHTNSYESFWNDLTKEAFLTGATLHLFNHPHLSNKTDLIYSGMAIVNKLTLSYYLKDIRH